MTNISVVLANIFLLLASSRISSRNLKTSLTLMHSVTTVRSFLRSNYWLKYFGDTLLCLHRVFYTNSNHLLLKNI